MMKIDNLKVTIRWREFGDSQREIPFEDGEVLRVLEVLLDTAAMEVRNENASRTITIRVEGKNPDGH